MDPKGLKTCGSWGSGSPTLTVSVTTVFLIKVSAIKKTVPKNFRGGWGLYLEGARVNCTVTKQCCGSVSGSVGPYVFGPPGSLSGSISQRNGSGSISQRYGSGSFYHQAKIVRKTLISTVFWLLFDFLSLKNDVNVPSKSHKQKNLFKNLVFFCILNVNDENSRIRIH